MVGKVAIGVLIFGAGLFVGVQLTEWYAKSAVTEAGDKAITKVFGSGYTGALVSGVFHGAVEQAVN